jgi:metallophosphoesterase superfamily enzyme
MNKILEGDRMKQAVFLDTAKVIDAGVIMPAIDPFAPGAKFEYCNYLGIDI